MRVAVPADGRCAASRIRLPAVRLPRRHPGGRRLVRALGLCPLGGRVAVFAAPEHHGTVCFMDLPDVAPDQGVTRWRFAHGLIVSCQAEPGDPFDTPLSISLFARAAELGGAAGIRACGAANIRAIRRLVSLPVIGLTKSAYP